MSIRYIVIAAMAAFGTYCLVTGEFIAHKWLAVKIILFAAILLNGVWIRRIAIRWQGAFDLVLADGDSRAQGEKMLVEINSMANRAAFLIWLLVVLMAFLGEVKPF
jgi:small-conductance mechanosensitive channel